MSDASIKHGRADNYWRDAERLADDNRQDGLRYCDHPNCAAAGTYRAPKGRDKLNEFYVFCLEHVQAYNKSWDFYKGLSIEQMDEARRQDVLGWRPTWPLGSLKGDKSDIEARAGLDANKFRAHVFQDFFGGGSARTRAGRGAGSAGGAKATQYELNKLTAEEQSAFLQFELTPKASWYEVKTRYRALVKTYHPDAHRSDAGADVGADAGQVGAEEEIKSINRAYAVLKRYFKRV